MPSVPLPMAVLGACSHGLALYGYNRFQVPNKLCAPEATKFFGAWTWLTFQTNVLCMLYFAAATCAHFVESAALSSIVVDGFPLAFSLGFALSIMYYALDHFNEENVQKRKKYPKMGYHHVELACHLEHAMSTPVALLNAWSITLPGPSPTNSVVLPYMAFYIGMTLVNRMLVRAWAYPIIDDAQRAAGARTALAFNQ